MLIDILGIQTWLEYILSKMKCRKGAVFMVPKETLGRDKISL